jgi:hypothetical protein
MLNPLNIAKDFVAEQLSIRQDIKGVVLVGSVAKHEATEFSDIDLRFILNSQVKYGQRIDTWRNGIYLDGTAESFEHYSNLDSILRHTIRANDMNQGHILYDPEDFFTNLQHDVRADFMNPYWISRRVKLITDRIAPGFENLQKAILEKDVLAICHHAGRLQFHLALLPLIALGMSPSSTRHLAQLGSIHPQLKLMICELEGSSTLSIDEVLQLTALTETWDKVNHEHVSHLNNYMLEKAKWMTTHDLHKEAVHALWINASFKAHPELQANKSKQQVIQLASRWLNSVNWTEQRLSAKLLETLKVWTAVKQTLNDP